MSEEIKKAVESIEAAVETVKTDLTDTVSDTVKTVKETVKEALHEASESLDVVADAVKEVVENVKEEVKEMAEEKKEDLIEGVKEVVEILQEKVDKAQDKVSEAVDKMVGKVEEEKEEKKTEEQVPEVTEAEASTEIVLNEEYIAELSTKPLKEIVQVFQEMIERGDQQEMYKYAEAIKASFYKALKREKIAIGFFVPSESITDDSESEEVQISNNPFAELERGFKDLFAQYRTSRTRYIQELEKKKDDNLAVKLQIIEDLKALLNTQEDLNKTFPEFRTLQNRWRDSGPVPQAKVKELYDTYQHYVELFYDFVKINNELRDLDFKKNLEAKIELCEKAEALANEENVVNAFNKLQKLHEEWKEFGPVEKEHREVIWERFKAATAKINKFHQGHFEKIKDEQKDNFIAKTALCEKTEALSEKEYKDSSSWNSASKELEEIQKEWRTIGFASKKENQRVYDRFRAACDKFYNRKRDYYSQFKDQITINLEKKIALCEKAEALKESTEWKETTDILIALQKEWKEIGPVSRKKSDQIWNRFRAACDHFFDNKEKQFGGVDKQYVDNLNKKRAIIAEIKNYIHSSREENIEALKEFNSRWREIGFVPFKEKDIIQEEFQSAVNAVFADVKGALSGARGKERRPSRDSYYSKETNSVRSERERLVQKFRKKESEISTYENNIGFFASSKNADALIKELNKKIEAAKAELQELEEKIKSLD